MRDSVDQLPRPALVSRIADALDQGSVLLVAGPGYGKTTALAEALATRSAAWVRCAPFHRDPGRLLESIVAALRDASPGVADVVAERMHAPGGPPLDVAALARTLADELERLLVDPLTVVFDDAESLEGSDVAIELVRDLLAVRNARLSVAIATRRPLPLRAAKLVASGRLAELGPADLAFTVQECAELVELRGGRTPSPSEAEELWAATEGWPLAAALVASGERFHPRQLTEVEALTAFVAEEVLDPLPDPLRDGLIDSSVAPELDPDLVAALGLPDGFLTAIAGHGVPLRRLDSDGGRYAHHPLIRDLLRDRLLRTRPPERRRELHAGCAAWLEAAGR
ncbi:MAG TPA: AAA family ATPase, partial [Thermoleophilaceae bacterium]|nr:AAA family ATPase [Thermoleophilaceae bacterium]